MTGTNHALSGALIGSILPLPIAIPTAFVSHFVIDALPHYGIKESLKDSSEKWRGLMFLDTLIGLSIAASAIYFRKWNMEICGWVAYSPDLLLVYYFYKGGKKYRIEPRNNRFARFHRKIQNEEPSGIYFEVILMLLLLPLFIIQVTK